MFLFVLVNHNIDNILKNLTIKYIIYKYTYDYFDVIEFVSWLVC